MVDETILNAALEISERRAELHRRMRTAILSNDLRSALEFACQLVGINDMEAAPHLELLPETITTESRLVSQDACTI